MKYFSEKLNKTFDSEKECLKAEQEYEKVQQQLVADQEKKANEISKRKKELSKVIEEAEDKLAEANKLYEIAQEKAAKILEESNKQVKEIMDVAEASVKNAEEAKFNAILNFNKEFGPYSISYTGAKAADEFNRSMKKFNKTFKDMIENLFIF